MIFITKPNVFKKFSLAPALFEFCTESTEVVDSPLK
jgi:hypothetical protein